jgi:putative endonuclease
MTPNRRIIIGRQGEDLAVQYLMQHGIRIIGRNIRSYYGEIDIVGTAEELTIFFEVRTRTSESLGFPEDSITTRKRKHLLATAQAYMQANPGLKTDWRIDILAIRLRPNSPPEIDWFENAVY